MALSDRARDFWDRISPRERALVALLSIALPLVAAIWLGLSIRDGLVNMETRNERTREALEIVGRLKVTGTTPEDPGIKIPDSPIALETYVETAATKTGLKFKGAVDTHKGTKAGILTTTVTVSLDDVTTDQLKSFLQEVEAGEKSEKVVAVTHLDVKRDWRDKKKLDVTMDISTYSNAEKPKTEGDGSDKDAKPDDKKKGG